MQSAASDLGLHCLPMSHKKDARLIWDNPFMPIKSNFPPLTIEPDHFRCKGSLVVFFIFIQILNEHSVSKQWRTWPDATFCGV